MIRALIIDEHALNAVGSALLSSEWFSEFSWPGSERGVRRVQRGAFVYLLSKLADEKSRLLIIKLDDTGLLVESEHPQQQLDRIVHVALSRFERTVLVPTNWHQYNMGSLYSVYETNRPPGTKSGQRLYFDKSPRGTDHIFVYARSDAQDFGQVPEDLPIFDRALGGYIDAAIAAAETDGSDGGLARGIELTPPLGSAFVGSASLDEWYSHKLTPQQRSFVDKGYDEPIRLKGAAGSGKTLSLAIKCLRDLFRSEDDKTPLRFAFITHSAAVAHETVPGMFDSLDPDWRWRRLKSSSVYVGSLYELARDLLRYDEKQLQPLSTDGREGREYQAIIIADAIRKLKSDTRFMNREFPNGSPKLKAEFLNANSEARFVYEIMNEFACVLDAENIRRGTPGSDRYLRADREKWQMELNTEADREIVLFVHDEYRRILESSEILSMDQMIADFNRYLETHEWNRLRDREGFDGIFVDELHFFNRAERMVFHNLISRRASDGAKMPLFMSYDLKQSPADSFLGGGGSESAATFFQRIKAGETQLVELTQVFRSTPEITKFLGDLDASFPALDLEGEWGTYAGESKQAKGSVPILREYGRGAELLDDVFARAQMDANLYGGKNVAVLCLNEKLFGAYLNAGRIRDKFIEIGARDQVHDLRYAGRKCVFSMPQYVAGLQFASVYLIHVDKAEIEDGDESIGQRRRFVSRCYLGASRASESLEIAVSRERGGASEILKVHLQKGSLISDNRN